jgi:hypothetical protein
VRNPQDGVRTPPCLARLAVREGGIVVVRMEEVRWVEAQAAMW